MKKMISALFIVISILFSAVTFAKSEAKTQVLPANTTSAICDAYPTCINVTNYSSYFIYVVVPSLGVDTSLYTNNMVAISSNDFYYKEVLLYDHYDRLFYDQWLPPHYNLVVYDGLNGQLKASAKQ
jgi:hypothetical protein